MRLLQILLLPPFGSRNHPTVVRKWEEGERDESFATPKMCLLGISILSWLLRNERLRENIGPPLPLPASEIQVEKLLQERLSTSA